MDMKQLVSDLTEAMTAAGVQEEQRRQVLIQMALIWGSRLGIMLDNAILADMESGISTESRESSVMTPEEAATILIDALVLARERVTADTIAVKQERRDQYKHAISDMHAWMDGSGRGDHESLGARLHELLGEDDRQVREALAAWA
jgi:hypothetical protein